MPILGTTCPSWGEVFCTRTMCPSWGPVVHPRNHVSILGTRVHPGDQVPILETTCPSRRPSIWCGDHVGIFKNKEWAWNWSEWTSWKAEDGPCCHLQQALTPSPPDRSVSSPVIFPAGWLCVDMRLQSTDPWEGFVPHNTHVERKVIFLRTWRLITHPYYYFDGMPPRRSFCASCLKT